MPRAFLLLAVAAGTTAVAAVARAEGDGHYCTSAGYVALELNTGKRKAPHVLKVVRFDAKRGPRWAGQVALEPFDVHAMVCGNDQVTLHGRTGPDGPWLSYVIDLDASRKPVIARHGPTQGPPQPDAREAPSLGGWASPGLTPLAPLAMPGGKPGRRFQLNVTRRSKRLLPAGQRHQVLTRLEELDAKGKVRRKLVLYKGTRVETGSAPS